jgi:hypothetical protein
VTTPLNKIGRAHRRLRCFNFTVVGAWERNLCLSFARDLSPVKPET